MRQWRQICGNAKGKGNKNEKMSESAFCADDRVCDTWEWYLKSSWSGDHACKI